MVNLVAASEKTPWNIPPEKQSVGISESERDALKKLNSNAIWAARPNEPREKELLDILKECCQQMQIKPVPKLFIYDSNKPNAASSKESKSIMFSTNLLDIMSREQIKAVMGHELTHQKHRLSDSIKDWAVIIGGLSAVAFIYEPLKDMSTTLARSKPLRWTLNAIVYTGAYIGYKIVHLWRDRQREFRSDQGGAAITTPAAMADALKILHKREEEVYVEEGKENNSGAHHLPNFLMPYPPMENRIARLKAEMPLPYTERLHEVPAEAAITSR